LSTFIRQRNLLQFANELNLPQIYAKLFIYAYELRICIVNNAYALN